MVPNEGEVFLKLQAEKQQLATKFSAAFEHTAERIGEFPNPEELVLANKILVALRRSGKCEDSEDQNAIIALASQFHVVNDGKNTVVWSGHFLPIQPCKLNRYLTKYGKLVSTRPRSGYGVEYGGYKEGYDEEIYSLGSDEIIESGLEFLFPNEEILERTIQQIHKARQILPQFAERLQIAK